MSFSQAVERLLRDESLRHSMSQPALLKAPALSQKHSVEQLAGALSQPHRSKPLTSSFCCSISRPKETFGKLYV
jgi:hypothetical protein